MYIPELRAHSRNDGDIFTSGAGDDHHICTKLDGPRIVAQQSRKLYQRSYLPVDRLSDRHSSFYFLPLVHLYLALKYLTCSSYFFMRLVNTWKAHTLCSKEYNTRVLNLKILMEISHLPQPALLPASLAFQNRFPNLFGICSSFKSPNSSQIYCPSVFVIHTQTSFIDWQNIH